MLYHSVCREQAITYIAIAIVCLRRKKVEQSKIR